MPTLGGARPQVRQAHSQSRFVARLARVRVDFPLGETHTEPQQYRQPRTRPPTYIYRRKLDTLSYPLLFVCLPRWPEGILGLRAS